MEGSTGTMEGVEREDAEDVRDGPVLPQSVEDALADKPLDVEGEMDATEWLMSSDGATEDEIAPVKLKLNVGSPTAPKIIEWEIVPLPDGEFKKLRQMSLGGRQQRRKLAADPLAMDPSRYNLMVVAAATIKPDLKAAAAAKGVSEIDVLAHRFQARPFLISQIAGMVSDISGGDESNVEIVAGNS